MTFLHPDNIWAHYPGISCQLDWLLCTGLISPIWDLIFQVRYCAILFGVTFLRGEALGDTGADVAAIAFHPELKFPVTCLKPFQRVLFLILLVLVD